VTKDTLEPLSNYAWICGSSWTMDKISLRCHIMYYANIHFNGLTGEPITLVTQLPGYQSPGC